MKNTERSTAYVKKKNIFVKPFKCSILNNGVTFGCMTWQFHGPCAKDRVVVTDANVRYRNIMTLILVVSIDMVNDRQGSGHCKVQKHYELGLGC